MSGEDDLNEPCPFLPETPHLLRATALREFRVDRGEHFYFRALECAQSLWQQGLPAQSILMLNRAFSADLESDDEILGSSPMPYAALRWILRNAGGDQFIGNPRRHFQHLATRMIEPRKALRIARAWACWYLARMALPDLPADELQLAVEKLIEPDVTRIYEGLTGVGLRGEADLWRSIALATEPARGS